MWICGCTVGIERMVYGTNFGGWDTPATTDEFDASLTDGPWAVRASVRGTIEPGKYADIVIVDGDPTIDVAVLQDPAAITAVFKSSRQVAAAGICVQHQLSWRQAGGQLAAGDLLG